MSGSLHGPTLPAGGGGGLAQCITALYIAGAINRAVVYGDPEIVLGEFTYDALQHGILAVVFRATLTTTAAGANTSLVKLYDVGPAVGPPVAPTLLATLTSNAAGGEGPLRKQSADLSGTMDASERVYRITAEVTVGVDGDEIYVGWAGIYVG